MTLSERTPLDRWHETLATDAADGWCLEWLTGVDETVSDGHITVLACLRRGGTFMWRATDISEHHVVEDISDIFRNAAWHQREVTEMFAVPFFSGDTRRLLTSADSEPTLLKSTPLPARLDREWPGAGGKKRARTPGVNPAWTT